VTNVVLMRASRKERVLVIAFIMAFILNEDNNKSGGSTAWKGVCRDVTRNYDFESVGLVLPKLEKPRLNIQVSITVHFASIH
jgi:hypothetical protein